MPGFSGWSRSADEDHDASELGEGGEVTSVVFVASDESSKAQHPSEEPLDVPPSSIAPQTSTILGLGLSPPVMRRDHLDPVAAQVIVQLVAVVGAIPDEFFGKVLYESRGERVVDELRFMPLTTRSPDGDRKTMTVCLSSAS